MDTERETIEFDVLFVGGGPASLAGAIRLMELAREKNLTLEVGLIEKGAEIGAHAVSGAILNPRALTELVPLYLEKGCPIEITVRGDEFHFLTDDRQYRFPMTPRYMHNKGFHVISLSKFARWLAGIAEEAGVNLFPGFAGKEVLYAEDGKTIIGVRTGDKGLDKDGKPKGNFEPGMDIKAKITIFGEGARGSLFGQIAQKLDIGSGKMPQVFETGIKEVIRVAEDHYFKTSKGNDIHTLGYPLGLDTPGGGFIYEMGDNLISIGFLVGLSYENPMLDPYEEFLRFKHHPFVANLIKGGEVIEQGARTVSVGGYFSMPKLAANGAMFVGGSAGMQNSPGLKGIHVSMKSGMLAAEASIRALEKGDVSEETLDHYRELFEHSWAKEEIYEGRNFAQALAKKGLLKILHLGSQYVTKGRGFRDRMRLFDDSETLTPLPPFPDSGTPIPACDGTLYVDKLTGVYLSKTMHREDQPSHLVVHDPQLCASKCFETYRNPCTRFCPGKVYEIIEDEKGDRRLKLNPSNCLHCKTCDIKDPYRNITWTCPEGGEGPGYTVA